MDQVGDGVSIDQVPIVADWQTWTMASGRYKQDSQRGKDSDGRRMLTCTNMSCDVARVLKAAIDDVMSFACNRITLMQLARQKWP
jgi:hypothetical protein